MKLISKKTNQDLSTIHQIIFETYHSGKIEFIKSPTKLIYYSIIKSLDEENLESLEKEFNILKQSKLDNLEKLYDVLNKKLDIDKALKEHLGIELK
jgi:hypothetical protein